MTSVRFSVLAYTSLLMIGVSCILFSCGETRQQRWDRSSPNERLRDAVKNPRNNPPGYGGNTYD